MQLADLQENTAQAETAAQLAAAETITVASFERRSPSAARAFAARAHRLSGPAVCPCCGNGRLRKIGEDVTETLELIPRQWKVTRPREVLLPSLRNDHPTASALPSDRARACGSHAARSCAVRQVRPAPASQSPERRL
jgi:transposase